MKILVTSGSTLTPIDRVRGITNIFSGRTGFEIAKHAVYEGHKVTLLGNSIAKQWYRQTELSDDDLERFSVVTFKTFEDLEHQMRTHLEKLGWDVVIHSAAVNDYKVDGVFKDAETVYNFVKIRSLSTITTNLPARSLRIPSPNPEGKIGSKLDELWLRLVPTPKLIDSIRDWGLGQGTLVKFKLEVNVSPEELFNRANKSRADSDADLIVANRLDDFSEWAEPSMQIIDRKSEVVQVSRNELPKTLINKLEELNPRY